MAVPNIDVNYLAVLISAVISMIIGSLWYSPLLFGNAWVKAGRISKKAIEKAKARRMGKYYIIAFIGSLLMAFILAHFVQYVAANNFTEGMQTGFWLWSGFIVPVLLGSVLWENKHVKYYLINVTYWIVNLVIMGGILAVWQ